MSSNKQQMASDAFSLADLLETFVASDPVKKNEQTTKWKTINLNEVDVSSLPNHNPKPEKTL
jgi:hypothetical protein